MVTTVLPAADADIQLDYVGSVANAAKVIAALYRGEKRLVFCDSKRLVEQLGAQLRELGVTTHLVHASLSLDERRRAEQAFAEGRDCVIVSTSALELGLDVGDLDRVIQVNAPLTVAAFLQRLGRSGRRTGNAAELPVPRAARGRPPARGRAAARLGAGVRRAGRRAAGAAAHRGPATPRALPAGRAGGGTDLAGMAAAARAHRRRAARSRHIWSEQGFLDTDGGMLFIGPEAERRFGHRHFMGLMAVFTAPPEFTVLHGRDEIGRTDPLLLADRVEGPRLLLLGGRSWRVTWTDWKRRRCFVEPCRGRRPGPVAVGRGRRTVLRDRPVDAGRAARCRRAGVADAAGCGILAGLRSDGIGRVHADGLVISRERRRPALVDLGGVPGQRHAEGDAQAELADEAQRVDDLSIRLRADLRPSTWRDAGRAVQDRLCLPEVDEKALAGLKFSEALPRHLAVATLAARLADLNHARAVLMESTRFEW